MLAKSYNPKKVSFPAILTEKHDGVAADFYCEKRMSGNKVLVRSRQDKPLPSVDHIREILSEVMQPGEHLIGELIVPGLPFKEASGLVRKLEVQPNIVLMIFDYYQEGYEDEPYNNRMNEVKSRFLLREDAVRFIPMTTVMSTDQIDSTFKEFMQKNPRAEGMVLRSLDGKYDIGSRSWGMMKLKGKPTLDLRVVGFEEAEEAKTKKPKGMIGRINVDYRGETIGCGPGKLTHQERRDIFANQQAYIGQIAEVEYMADPTYDALRQPTFQRWRPDKTEPSYE